jgi:hypothetical protein
MKVKRTWTKHSLRAGQIQYDDEATVRTVFGQTAIAHHSKGECENELCHYCPEPAMRRLLAGAKVKTFFCDFELVEA